MAEKIYGVVEINTVASQTNPAGNRYAINMTEDIQDGNVFTLDTKSTAQGESQVWVATKPTANTLTNLWMANGLVDIKTGEYSNLDPNPQHYVNVAGKVFDAFKLYAGDLITLTAESLAGTFSTSTKFVNATADSYALTWGDTQTADVTSMALVGTSYISIGNGSLGSTQRVTAYQFNVLAN